MNMLAAKRFRGVYINHGSIYMLACLKWVWRLSLLVWRLSLLGWRPSLGGLEAIAIRDPFSWAPRGVDADLRPVLGRTSGDEPSRRRDPLEEVTAALGSSIRNCFWVGCFLFFLAWFFSFVFIDPFSVGGVRQPVLGLTHAPIFFPTQFSTQFSTVVPIYFAESPR